MALVHCRRLLIIPGSGLLGLDGRVVISGDDKGEPVSASQVAGAVPAERLERRERAVASLAHELSGALSGRGAAQLLPALGHGAPRERDRDKGNSAWSP
jgi:hypothetical protein